MTTLAAGSVFAGEWRVLARLAEGGMGTVYKVEQLSTGQIRALKVLRAPLWEDQRARERFEQEAMVVSKIASDHLVKVINAGIESEEGAPWIAMEFLEGETLRKRVDSRGPYGRLEALELARQLCHALGAAHDAGIVHRDLKPENIFVAHSVRAGEQEIVKLLDFGIATALEEFETSATVTSVIGSPLWMAPEQVRRERIRPATDVWALGLLMFWVLTGKPYWRHTFPADAVIYEKMVEPLVLASVRAGEFACGDAIPPGFDPWFARCVSRKIDERFRDAEEAFDAFERIMTDPRMPRKIPPSRARWATIAAMTALAGSGAVWAARSWLIPSPASVTLVVSDAQAIDIRARSPLARTLHTDAATPVDAFDAAGVDVSLVDILAVQPEASTVVSEPNTAGSNNAVARTNSNANSRVLATPVQRGNTNTAPMIAGYSVQAAPGASGFCRQANARQPWKLVPDWYLQRVAELRLDLRLRRVEQEGTMASRLSDPVAQRTASENAARLRRELDNDRAMLSADVDRAIPSLRSSLQQSAQTAHCTQAGLQLDAHGLYAIWCCP